MSTTLIHAARARITDAGNLLLEVKSWSSNCYPAPTPDEWELYKFCACGAEMPIADAEGIAVALESLARDYEGRCIKEHGKELDGARAYLRWVKRIQAVAPDLKIRGPRPSRLVWGFHAAFQGVHGCPTVSNGTVITPEIASRLIDSGRFIRVQWGLRPNEPFYLAFVKDGVVYVANKRGARRGYSAQTLSSMEEVKFRAAVPAISHAQDGSYVVGMVRDGSYSYIERNFFYAEPLSKFKATSTDHPTREFLLLDKDDAECAVERLKEQFPDTLWIMRQMHTLVDQTEPGGIPMVLEEMAVPL